MSHPPKVKAWVSDFVNQMHVCDKTGWSLDYVRTLDEWDLMKVLGFYEGKALARDRQAKLAAAKRNKRR